MKKSALFLFLLIAAFAHCSMLDAQPPAYLYRDFKTGFSDISTHADSSGLIIINRTASSNVFEARAFDTRERNFDYTIRLLDTPSSTSTKSSESPVPPKTFGLVWNYVDDKNFNALSICRKAENRYDDISRIDYLELTLLSVANGKTQVMESKTVSGKQYLSQSQYHSFSISYKDKKLTISGGHERLSKWFSIDCAPPGDSCKIGYFASPEIALKIKRICFKSNLRKDSLYATSYSRLQLDSIFANSTDPMEGYWCYLDRNTDDKYFELGGKYTIAIVKNQANEYDVLYVDGAKLYPEIWHPFMRKGSLLSTSFIGHYDMVWHDAVKKRIDDETYAALENFLLVLYFPMQKSQVRFHKLQMPPDYSPIAAPGTP